MPSNETQRGVIGPRITQDTQQVPGDYAPGQGAFRSRTGEIVPLGNGSVGPQIDMRSPIDYMGRKGFHQQDGRIIDADGKLIADTMGVQKKKAQEEAEDRWLKQQKTLAEISSMKTPVTAEQKAADAVATAKLLAATPGTAEYHRLQSEKQAADRTRMAEEKVAKQASMAAEGARKALQAAGVDLQKGEDRTLDEINASTSGWFQKIGADALGAMDITTSGKKSIGSLGSTQAAIVLDYLNGKLGAGISTSDREAIDRMMGDIANPNKTAEERASSWKTAKNRLIGIANSQGVADATAAPTEKLVDQIPTGAAPKIPTNSSDHQETMFNAKKAIAKNPTVRDAVISKMKAGGYDTSGL
jgi:hypothetical protein